MLVLQVMSFLKRYWDGKSPLLLGLSGGPDSKSLLYALLEAGVRPHIAHVDCGWRRESREEAEMLQREAEALQCPFFTTRLQGADSEEAAREGRLAFFASLTGYQAVLLAHQAEDLAETVLKRVLEGAHLSQLGGMREVSSWNQITLWRPFLKVRKEEILRFLQERQLTFLMDRTNEDVKYLRSRMRLQMFPYLNEIFGKEVVGNLGLLSERAYELNAYLEKKMAPFDLNSNFLNLNGLEEIEQRYLLQKKSVLRDNIERILAWVKKGKGKHKLQIKGGWLVVEKGEVQWIYSDVSCLV